MHLAVTNRGSGSFEYGNSQFLLVDDAGLYAFDIGWRYSAAALGAYQPLDLGPLREGRTETGWLLFEISNVARPSAMIYLGYETPPYFGLLAWLDPVPLDETRAIEILDSSGNPLGTITIDTIITNFELTDDGIDPPQGSSTLALAVSVTNTSDERWRLRDDDFWIADEYGLFYPRTFYDRDMSSYQSFPELGYHADPQEIARGVLMFELPDETDFAQLLYVPNDKQMHLVGGQRPQITLRGDVALQSIDIDARTSLAPECTGVEAWMEGSLVSLKAAATKIDEAFEDEDAVTAKSLRDVAVFLRTLADDQRNLTVPEAARQVQTDLLAMLDVSAEAFDNAADRLESSESIEAVADSLNAAHSPVTTAANKVVKSMMALSQECPIGLI